MNKRERTILSGAVIGGLLGGAVAYLVAEPKEPGVEEETSLMANIGVLEVLALTKAALGFFRQWSSIKEKGAKGRGPHASRA